MDGQVVEVESLKMKVSDQTSHGGASDDLLRFAEGLKKKAWNLNVNMCTKECIGEKLGSKWKVSVRDLPASLSSGALFLSPAVN